MTTIKNFFDSAYCHSNTIMNGAYSTIDVVCVLHVKYLMDVYNQQDSIRRIVNKSLNTVTLVFVGDGIQTGKWSERDKIGFRLNDSEQFEVYGIDTVTFNKFDVSLDGILELRKSPKNGDTKNSTFVWDWIHEKSSDEKYFMTANSQNAHNIVAGVFYKGVCYDNQNKTE